MLNSFRYEISLDVDTKDIFFGIFSVDMPTGDPPRPSYAAASAAAGRPSPPPNGGRLDVISVRV